MTIQPTKMPAAGPWKRRWARRAIRAADRMRRTMERGAERDDSAHSRGRVMVLCGLMSLAIFTAGLLSPPELATVVLYSVLPTLTLRTRKARLTVAASALATVFLVLGSILSAWALWTTTGAPGAALANAALGMFALWTTTSLCVWQKRSWRERARLLGQRRLAEEDAGAAERVAQEVRDAREDFLAGVTDDLRDALTAIQGHAELLGDAADGAADGDNERESAEAVLRHAARLLELSESLGDLSQLSAGEMRLEAVECSPGQIVQELAFRHGQLADAKGLPLSVEYASPIPRQATADPQRLRQTVDLLLANAVRFTEFGGVRLVVGFERCQGQGTFQIEILDTGLGFSPQQIRWLEQPFDRPVRRDGRLAGAAGIELLLARRLSQALGGELSVESPTKEGGALVLRLPLEVAADVELAAGPEEFSFAAPAPDEDDAFRGAPLKGRRILVVDDEPDNRLLLSRWLGQAGATVKTATNGRDGVAAAMAPRPFGGRRHGDPQEPYDLILMDLRMPVCDGLEAARRLRKRGYTLPIVAMSGQRGDAAEEQARRAGCNGLLPKPFDRKSLLKFLRLRLPVETEAVRSDPL